MNDNKKPSLLNLATTLRSSNSNDLPKHREEFDSPAGEVARRAASDSTEKKSIKNKEKAKSGRKPSGNVTIQSRCRTDDIKNLEKSISKLNAKGLGLDIRSIVPLLVQTASELSSKELQELVVKARLAMTTDS
jgi:hypothetical protein